MSDSTKRRRLLDELYEISTIVETNSLQELELSDEIIINTPTPSCSISSTDLMNNSISTTTIQCPESVVVDLNEQEKQYHQNEQLLSSDFNDDYNCILSSSENSDQSAIDNEDLQEPTINDQLSSWSVEHNISNVAVSSLLGILKKHQCFKTVLPKDARTLLQTSVSSKKIILKTIDPGYYYHFGILSGIKQFYPSAERCNTNTIKLVVGIDGLPLTKSSGSCFWPILCYIRPYKENVFPIGIYWGYKKPLDSNEFLNDFCEEIVDLINNGIQFKIDNQNIVTKKVILETIVCDVPAKSFVLKIKGHAGFFSCTRCETKGQYMRNRLCFPEINALKRTHESFKNKLQEQHHLTNTTMTKLINIPNLDIIQIFSLDYMHLCCLGVIKKLIRLWLSKGSKNIRLSRQQVNKLNILHLSLRNCVTYDFPRKPRSLDEFSNWKATEFRLFVLYTGPVILKKVLNEKLYSNFLCLHVAFTILLSSNSNQNMISFCDKLLKYFIKDFCSIYGTEQASHNIHALQHIVDDFHNFGPLDNASAFPFENHMRTLKKTVRKASQPLQQAVKRYKEQYNFNTFKTSDSNSNNNNKDIVCKKQHQKGPLLDNLINPLQYHVLITNKFKINCNSEKDSYIMSKSNEIIKVINIICSSESKEKVIVGYTFLLKRSFFIKPMDSIKLGIFVVSNLSSTFDYCSINEIKCKYMIIKVENEQIAFPVIHTLE